MLSLHVIRSDVAYANNKASFENKRLLLNDPDVTASRLSSVEKSIEDMVGLTQQLQTQNSNMQTTIAHLEATLLKETSTRKDLQKNLSQLQTELAQEKVKVSQALFHGRLLHPFV